MSFNISFKPQSSFELIRCGRDFDGGYLLTKKTIKETDTLVSFGILDDCSFEDEFLKINPIKALCFDHTVNNSYWKKRFFNDLGASIYNLNFKFFKNTLTRYFQFKKFFKSPTNFLKIETIKKGSLRSIITENNLKKNIFLKIDIEGSEYRILDDILTYQDKLSGAAIEFHDVDINKKTISKFIENFDLILTHIHPNNFGGEDEFGDPLVIELTFEKNPEINNKKFLLPNEFDQPNNPNNKDITLKFE